MDEGKTEVEAVGNGRCSVLESAVALHSNIHRSLSSSNPLSDLRRA